MVLFLRRTLWVLCVGCGVLTARPYHLLLTYVSIFTLGTIGTNSCRGDAIVGPYGYIGYACSSATGTIGDNACYEYVS